MKKVMLRILQSCGLFELARNSSANMARILMYHNFRDDSNVSSAAVGINDLRAQFEFLREHFNVISLKRLTELVRSKEPLGRNSVVLTIDDGRRNFYQFAFPLLREFQLPATFFVVTSFIDGNDWLWTDKILWLAGQSNPASELSPDNLDQLFLTLNRLRPEVRNTHIASLARQMLVNIPLQPPPQYAPCSWLELREMADSRLIEIGSHSVSHPIFSSISDEESWCELTASRVLLQDALGTPVRLFCFPNGKPCDYHPSHLGQVREAGYSAAVVTRSAFVSRRDSAYELPRIGVDGSTDMLSFSKYLDGVDHYQHMILRSLQPSHR